MVRGVGSVWEGGGGLGLDLGGWRTGVVVKKFKKKLSLVSTDFPMKR